VREVYEMSEKKKDPIIKDYEKLRNEVVIDKVNEIFRTQPEPDFVEEYGVMTVTFNKDKWTEKNLKKMDLNARQVKAVMYVKEKGRITNREYQDINTISNKTAYLELSNLVKKDIFKVLGKGKAVSYSLKVMER